MNKHIEEYEEEYRWLAKYFCTDYESNKELYPLMSMPYMTVVEIMRQYNYDEQHNKQ